MRGLAPAAKQMFSFWSGAFYFHYTPILFSLPRKWALVRGKNRDTFVQDSCLYSSHIIEQTHHKASLLLLLLLIHECCHDYRQPGDKQL